jgi:hypothetical protein
MHMCISISIKNRLGLVGEMLLSSESILPLSGYFRQMVVQVPFYLLTRLLISKILRAASAIEALITFVNKKTALDSRNTV